LNLGGVDGLLLHITDMAWKRIEHPSEIVEVRTGESTLRFSSLIVSATASLGPQATG
jgi:hypothetical protein